MSIIYNWEIGLLNDYYGSLLTDNQSTIISMYYDENLSLAEIAAIRNISRNAIRDTIVRGTKKLEEFEQKLSLLQKTQKILNMLDYIYRLSNNEIQNELSKVIDEINKI